MNPSRGDTATRAAALACAVFLLLCLDFLRSDCFHMAANVILELPLVASSVSHQGFSITSPPPIAPPSILSWGLKEFHTTRWSHLPAFPHTLQTMGLVLGSVGPTPATHRRLPEGMFPYVLLMHSCSAPVRISLKLVLSKGAFFNCWSDSFLLRMFLQTSDLMRSLGKARPLGRTYQLFYVRNGIIKYCQSIDH